MADNQNASPTSVELLGALSDFLPHFEQMLATLEAHPRSGLSSPGSRSGDG